MVGLSLGGKAILALIVTYLELELAFSSDCGIDFGNDSPFAFTEVRENIPVGALLGSFPVTNILQVELSSAVSTNSFIDVQLNDAKTEIHFYLRRPLIEYRTQVWSPSVEIDFNVTCSASEDGNGSGGGGYGRQSRSVKSKAYTFMSLIEDCNLYAPEFKSPETYFNINFPWALSSPLNNVSIKVSDIDYNKNHATVRVECESQDCQHFEIYMNSTSDNYKGHHYEVYVYPKDDYSTLPKIEVGKTFSLTLVANDSVHTTNTIIRFTTTKVANGIGEKTDSSPFPTGPVAGIGGGLVIVCILLGGAWGYTMWRRKDTDAALRQLTEAEIREFLEGTAGFGEGLGKRSIDVNMPILSKPYNKGVFDIPREKLKIDETSILGTGFFGVVMKGVVTLTNGDSLIVAVKRVKRNVGIVYFKALLSELKIMSFIGNKNSNVVSLIGACTHNIRKREVFIAVEYCANGNLHNYLKTNREGFISLMRDGKILKDADALNTYAYSKRRDSVKTMSTLDLLKWCHQIANGLDYLASVGVIHGDLATRNVLLDSKNIAKIADFGLSRRLVDVSSYYYTKQSQAPLPWKWMAPESLKDMKFSKESDIWSFGIVLWEIFTIGQTPYPGLNWSENFVETLEGGLRLGQPMYASNSLYEIMMDCWTQDPRHRPNAFDIKTILDSLINSLLQQSEDDGYMRVLGTGTYLYIGDVPKLEKEPLEEEVGHSDVESSVEC